MPRLRFNFIVLCLVFGVALARLDQLKTTDDYLNICMLGKHHKEKPSQEDGLAERFCSPWANRSCCTHKTAHAISTDGMWLNFDWDHCAPLSAQCREYFIMDSCFYSCSPNVGPWLVEDKRKIRDERFKDVPLCKRDCDFWWNSCVKDLTCTDKWAENFDWSSGINKCPAGATCRSFGTIFKNSTNFCENVFGSFKVAKEGDENCFHLWFDPKYGNPNEAVARKKINEILNIEQVEHGGSTQKEHGKGRASSMVVNPWLYSLLLLVAVLASNLQCTSSDLTI